MFARDQGESFLHIRAQFIGGTGFAGIVTRYSQTAADRVTLVFKTTDIMKILVAYIMILNQLL